MGDRVKPESVIRLHQNMHRTVGSFDTELFLTGEDVDWDYWRKCLSFDSCFMPVQKLATPCDYIIQDIVAHGRDGIGGKKSKFDEDIISEIWKNFEDSDQMRAVIYEDYSRNKYGSYGFDELGDMLDRLRRAFHKPDKQTNG